MGMGESDCERTDVWESRPKNNVCSLPLGYPDAAVITNPVGELSSPLALAVFTGFLQLIALVCFALGGVGFLTVLCADNLLGEVLARRMLASDLLISDATSDTPTSTSSAAKQGPINTKNCAKGHFEEEQAEEGQELGLSVLRMLDDSNLERTELESCVLALKALCSKAGQYMQLCFYVFCAQSACGH